MKKIKKCVLLQSQQLFFTNKTVLGNGQARLLYSPSTYCQKFLPETFRSLGLSRKQVINFGVKNVILPSHLKTESSQYYINSPSFNIAIQHSADFSRQSAAKTLDSWTIQYWFGTDMDGTIQSTKVVFGTIFFLLS